jgi:hypothetical protein
MKDFAKKERNFNLLTRRAAAPRLHCLRNKGWQRAADSPDCLCDKYFHLWKQPKA